MNQGTGNLVAFLGHLHPMLVHLPIGALVLLGVLEAVPKFTRGNDIAQNGRWILAFSFGAALAAAGCGWMLASDGSYEPGLLSWHRAIGIALLPATLVTFLLRGRNSPRAYQAALVATLLLLVAAGHLGASLTHGRDFLTRYMPLPRRLGFGSAVQRKSMSLPVSSSDQSVFATCIQPILQRRCAACHGPEKHKADLRVDTWGGLFRGGQNGPVLRPGHATDSPLVQRMLLPLDADGRMPPEDQDQPSSEEIALLKWWINAGAPSTQSAEDLKPTPEIQHLLGVVSKKATARP